MAVAYRLSLRLISSPETDPSWLVGALRSAYEGAEVMSVERTSMTSIDALVRYDKAVPKMDPGDLIVPVTQELELMPGVPLPMAMLDQALPITGSAEVARSAARLLDAAGHGLELRDAGRLGLAVLMVGTTAWLISRIKKKGVTHAQPR